MAKKSVLYNIYADLVAALSGVIESKYIFLKDRPKVSESDEPMKKFIVIDLPVSVRDFVIGNNKTFLTTTGVFYVFTQARANGTLDVNLMGDFVDKVHALFPYVGKYCSVSDPVLRMTGSDNEGFQVATITFGLECKWRAFD